LLMATTQTNSVQRVGVVNLNTVFEGYQKRNTLEKQLNEERKALKKRIDGMEKGLAKMRVELELLDRQTTRFQELEKQARHLLEDLKVEQRHAAEALQRKQAQFHNSLLAEIRAVIGRYGEEQGFTLIVQKEFTLSSEARSWRSVLYHDPQIDLTQKILEVLNQEG
ncbi:MAG: OmpH family outer membrane protein, partial [Planctomycetota bacterium]